MDVRRLIHERGRSKLHRTYLLVFCSVTALITILTQETIYSGCTDPVSFLVGAFRRKVWSYMTNKAIKILSLLIILLLIAGCSTEKDTVTGEVSSSAADTSEWTEGVAQIFAMDTIMNLTANGINAEAAVEAAEAEIYELEGLLDVTDESSDIYAVNASSGQPITVSEQTADIVTKALEISDLTDGAFNIAMYPIIREWGFTTGDYKIPKDDTIKALLQNIDYSQVSIKNDSITIPKGMAIDAGGIAKGFTGDFIRDILEAQGITSAIIDLGGDVQVMGTRADGSDWRVAIQNPLDSDYLGILSVTDCAVMTSGSYERYFTGEGGNIYHHIMDPETGRPAESGLVSVTIVTKAGYRGDALATALFIMGADRASEFWRLNGDFEAIFVTENSEIYITEGLVDSFELSGSFKDMPVNVIKL